MTRKLKWALTVGVLMVFAAGVATGMFVGARRAHDVLAFKHHRHMGERMRTHLTRELELTPEQLEKLSPIFDDTSRRLQEIRSESGRRVGETLREAHAAMAPHLTPEQRERAATMKMRHKRHLRRRGSHPPDGEHPHHREERAPNGG